MRLNISLMTDLRKKVKENSKLFVTCSYIALVIALTQIISSEVQKYYINNTNPFSAFLMLIFLILLYGFLIFILVKSSVAFRKFLLRMFGVEAEPSKPETPKDDKLKNLSILQQ